MRLLSADPSVHPLECQHHLRILGRVSILRQFEDSPEAIDPSPDGRALMREAKLINVSSEELTLGRKGRDAVLLTPGLVVPEV